MSHETAASAKAAARVRARQHLGGHAAAAGSRAVSPTVSPAQSQDVPAQARADVPPAHDGVSTWELAAGVRELAVVLDDIAASIVAAFLPLPDELDLRGLFAILQTAGTSIVVPRVKGEALEFVMYDAEQTRLGRFGINEPTGDQTRSLDQCAAVLVPALACDAAGHRLGRGGGYYDRALTGIGAHVWKVGCVIDANLWPAGEVPVEPHDVVLDAVLTPERLLVLREPSSPRS